MVIIAPNLKKNCLFLVSYTTLKVQILARSNFGENKFSRELIFAILGIFAKFAKFSSRKICQKMHFREIRENKFPWK